MFSGLINCSTCQILTARPFTLEAPES